MGKSRAESLAGVARDEVLVARLEALHAKNVTAIDELRGVVAEAHGVLRDLRQEIKKAEQIGPAIVTVRMRKEVQRAIATLDAETDESIRELIRLTESKITKRFDDLMKTLMGEEDPNRLSIADIVDRLGPLVPVLVRVMRGEERIGQVDTVRGVPRELRAHEQLTRAAQEVREVIRPL
jgi:hypothetical protein